MTKKSSCERLEQKVAKKDNMLKESEDVLREKGLQLKAIAEAFDGDIYLCSQDYRIEFMNEHYVKRTGYDATGEVCYKALHNRDSICPWCLRDRVVKGETVHCEVLTSKNNWFSVVSTPIYHPDGSISKLAMILDISERKRLENSLKQKVEEQKLLLDNIQTQIWYLLDPETYGAANKARAEFLGLKNKDFEHKSPYDIVSKEEAEVCIAGNKEVFDKKIQVHSEEWAVNGKGEKRLLSITKTPKLDKNGNVEYVVCSGEDITDYRNTEESLRQSKERLDLAMEATNDALWDWDLTTKKAYFSHRYYTMLGYKPNEIGQDFNSLKALIHPDDKETALNIIIGSIKKKIDSFQVEFRLKTKQGKWRWIMSRGKVVDKDENGNPVRMIGTHVDITDRKLNEEALRLSEAHLREENIRLKSSFKGSNHFGDIIGKSKKMHEVYEIILKAALSNANVIIYGESGTGKELVAKTIHDLSNRGHRKFVTVHCGAIPENLIESEFFGYKRGAFTGANIDKLGYLDCADGGTLFLDEVGEIDLIMQVKLLRAIEGGEYTPIGSNEIKKSDIRIIAATNRDLKNSVEKGNMREDFYYRIHIIPVHLPPLRERKEDIPLLIQHFLQTYCEDKNIPAISENIMKSMLSYDWPGNVRELQNTIHRYITLKEIDFTDIPQSKQTEPKIIPDDLIFQDSRNLELRVAMENFEKKYIEKSLQEHQWNRSKVASILGINRRTLFRKMKNFGMS